MMSIAHKRWKSAGRMNSKSFTQYTQAWQPREWLNAAREVKGSRHE